MVLSFSLSKSQRIDECFSGLPISSNISLGCRPQRLSDFNVAALQAPGLVIY